MWRASPISMFPPTSRAYRPSRCSVLDDLLTDGSVGCDRQGVARLVAISRRGRVLDQPDIVREDIARDGSRCVFITRVLVIDSERNASPDWHVAERDLVPVRRNWCERNAVEVAPAWMYMCGPDASDACLRRGGKIGASYGRSQKNDPDGSDCRLGRRDGCLIAPRRSETCDDGDNAKSCPHVIRIMELNHERYV